MRVSSPLLLSILLFSACQNPGQSNSTTAKTTTEPKTTSGDTVIVGQNSATATSDSATATPDTTLAHRESIIKARETAAVVRQQADQAQEHSTIEIRIKATKEQRKEGEDATIPEINLDSTDKQIANLIDPNEIVLPYQKVKLMIDYPLARPVFFELTSQTISGFTRKQLIQAISKKYHEIYTEEEKTAKTKTIPLKDRKGMYNRNETDGKYGIWGHDLSDLVLTDITVYQTSDGTILLDLDIES
jgi:hypothetical protein